MQFPDLAIHTMTTRPWSISQCIEGYARRGIGGISIWRQVMEGESPEKVRQQLSDAGLQGVSLVRSGFFTGKTKEERQAALVDNQNAIREAAALGLGSVVLVCGATVGQSPKENFQQIKDGIESLLDEASEHGVRLLVEPLHPLYAGDRSAICSMAIANQLCEEIDHPQVAIALDVYHVWWELDLAEQIAKAAKQGRLATYHICDYKPEQKDRLEDRGIMGEGCADLRGIDAMMSENGFSGMREVEIFSAHWWQRDQDEFLDAILAAYQDIYHPQNA